MTKKPTYQDLEQRIRLLEEESIKIKQAEDDLRLNEEKYRILLDESSDPIFSFTPEGRYTFVNKAFAAGVGKQIADIVWKTIWDVFAKEEADMRFAALSQVFQTGAEKVIDVRVPRPDGDRIYITTITPIKNTENTVVSIICSSKDVTERRQAEEYLRRSRELLNATERLSGVGGWEWNVVSQTMTWTDGTYRIHDFDPVLVPAGSPEHIEQSLACYSVAVCRGGGRL